MRPLRNISLLFLLGLIIAYGCYPGGGSISDDYTIVRTQYDTDYDFGSKKTYYMPDTMAFSTNVDEDLIDADELDKYEAVFLNAVERNMDLRGYERVTDTNEIIANGVDLVVFPGAILSENTGSVWWPGYGWWGGYYPPGWGWGGGWYYPPGWGGYWSYYSYTSGSAIINLADYDSYDDTDGELIYIEWDVLINGLFQGVNVNKIDALVNQAFQQSKYIKSNQ
jgi:hypothetical protein